MTEKDLESVIAIENISYSHPWTLGMFRDCLGAGYCCRLLEEKGKIIAYGVMSMGAGESHMLNVCVHPDKLRCGFGRGMLGHLLDIAKRYGTNTAFLEVRQSNKAAWALYHHIGFNEVGVRRNYYPGNKRREDACILALALSLD
ncbi:MAG: ribosomal protein S18-alanine N-acetyltransferase [Gammaproteobacteria bacterium]|nr:ribosomal protein S18-alanine N-acetyltransferase [Gammaproteobacteria bacterium]